MKKLFLLLLFAINGFSVYSQCFNGVLFPSGAATLLCGTAGWSIPNAWPGEYSNVNVVAGNQYTFTSSVGTDFITISNAAGTSSLQTGVGSVSYTPGFTGTVRFYRHLSSQCGTNQVNRTVTVTCTTSTPGGNLTFYFGELTSPESENLIDGQNTSVPVRTLGFQNVGSFQFTILLGPCATFRSTPPTIVGLANIHPGLVFHSYEINPAGTLVTFTWFTATSLSLANATKLFDIIIEGPGNGQGGICCDNLYFVNNPVEIRAYNNVGAEMNVTTTDTHAICEAPLRICGCIIRENNSPVGNVTVKLMQGNTVVSEVLTGIDGCYEFSNLQVGGTYTIVPTKLINPKNGVDPNDASLVAQYAGNQETLTSPYKIVAGDVIVDANGKILVNDAQLISRVAGISAPNDFGTQPSWKFVPSDYVFPDIQKTFSYNDNFPKTRTVNNINGDFCEENFIGIKMGDINLNANPQNAQGDVGSRSVSSDFLIAGPGVTAEDSIFTLKIKAGVFQGVKDFQVAFAWDKDELEYQRYTTNEFGIPVSSLSGLFIDGDSIAKADGRLYLGWYDPTFNASGVTLQSEAIVAEVVFKLKDLSLDVINFDQDTSIHAFYTNNQDRPVDIILNFKNIVIDLISGTSNSSIDRNYRVYPTLSTGTIHVQTSEMKEYILEMYDMSGRQLRKETHTGDSSIEAGNLVSGQYMLKITEVLSGETGTFRIIKK